MVLLTLTDSPKNTFLSAALSLDVEHQYYLQPQNVFLYSSATLLPPTYHPAYFSFSCEGWT